MWVFFPEGLVSIVMKPGDEKLGLTVRGRDRRSVDAVRAHCPSAGAVQEGGGTDYEWRFRAPREEVADAVAALVDDIDYSGFKETAGDRGGRWYELSLLDVWLTMREAFAHRP